MSLTSCDDVEVIILGIHVYRNSVYSFIFHVQYAHRACVQRWCNEKGDTTCEICHEVGLSFLSFIPLIHVSFWF